MYPWLLGHLKCPQTEKELELFTFVESNGRIKDGVLVTADRKVFYPVFEYIPRFVSTDLYQYDKFLDQYRDKLVELRLAVKPVDLTKNKLKSETNLYFGWEWQEYKRWGWQDAVDELDTSVDRGVSHSGTLEKTTAAFKVKSLFDDADLDGKLVLDAGCGNGRYSFQASQNKARVIGIDLGEGSVLAALENTFHIPEIQIVQGDLLNPPFKDMTFDSAFSIGVLMHTGNTKLAMHKISKCVKVGGVFTTHVYRKGNLINEFNDYLIRKYNRFLSLEEKVRFSQRMAKWSQALSKRKFRQRPLSWWINHFVQIRNTYHQMFDWWSAPVASHHTYNEIEKYMEDNNFSVIATRNKPYKGFTKYFPPIGVVTVKGKRK